MDGKGKISEYRSKLDKTLSSPDLTNDEVVHNLVKNQILQSHDSKLGEYTEYVVEKRSKEVSDFIRELRSASVNDEKLKSGDDSLRGWKVKQDTNELRVMYREGPEGTPLHSLLCEGYVDGPVDVCLCISSESDLYKKWWPQIVIPTFKVIASQCVQKVRMGEQVSVVRMKLSWPMSSREVLFHYFLFEYFQDGLVVVLLKSISDSENIDRSTHGFTKDGIPDPQDVVRMDLYGGFALQKVTPDRSYFRTIANMDIKLDFVPPAIINFIARQLVGSGFKLYKKEVASVSKGDGKFLEALRDPLYTHIHAALYPQNGSMTLDDTPILLLERSGEALQDDSAKENGEIEEFEERDSDRTEPLDDGKKNLNYVLTDDITEEDRTDKLKVVDRTEVERGHKVAADFGEFKEKDTGLSESLDNGKMKLRDNCTDEITEEARIDKMEVKSTKAERGHEITEHFGYDIKTKVGISPEVQRALATLEKAIFVFRQKVDNSPVKGQSQVKIGNMLRMEDDAGEELVSSKKNGTCVESSKVGSAELTSRKSSDSHGSRHKGSNSYARETNQSKIAPASPDEDQSNPSHIKNIDLHSSIVPDNKTESRLLSADPSNGKKATKRRNRIERFCCLSFSS